MVTTVSSFAAQISALEYPCEARTFTVREKALTFVLSSLLFTATVLEGLFGEYHSSSAALGQQRPEVTKQPLTCDWSATSEALCDVKSSLRSKYRGKVCAGGEYNDNECLFSLSIFVPARRNAFSCLLLSPSWDWTVLPLFTPFVGPDGSSYRYGGRFLHLDAVTTQGWFSQVFHCNLYGVRERVDPTHY